MLRLMSDGKEDAHPKGDDDLAEIECTPAGSVKFWERDGSFIYGLYYESRVVDCSRFLATPKQQAVVDAIVLPGVGAVEDAVAVYPPPSSTVLRAPATTLNASVCLDFMPTDPGRQAVGPHPTA
jgi:hypothetical protein